MTKIEEFYESVIKIGIYIVPFIPLIVFESLFFPFITSKNFVFRIIIELIFVLWFWLALKYKEFRPKKSIILYTLLALFVVLILATIFGVNPYRSFWSNAERMEGLFGMFHFLAFFLILVGTFRKEKDWTKFWWASIGASFIVAIYSIFQLLGKLEIHQGGVRIDATFGNASYLAIYLIFHVFLALYLATKYRHVWLRWGLLALAILHSFLVYQTATRGSIIGLLGGLFILAIIIALGSSGARRKWAIAFLVVLVLVPILSLSLKSTSFVAKNPVLSRVTNISFSENTTQSRFIIWGMAIDSAKERPILGWGPENFTYIFTKEYDARLLNQEPWFDRAHNVFLDWLTSAGILGLLAYLGVFLATIFTIWRLYKKGTLSRSQGAIFASMLAAYFFHNLFVFDNMTSYMLFFAVMAYLYSLDLKDGAYPQTTDPESQMSNFRNMALTAVLALLVVFSLYSYNIKTIKASSNLVQTIIAMASAPDRGIRDIEGGQRLLERAIELDPHITRTEAREQFAQHATNVIRNNFVPEEQKEKFFLAALAQMEEQAKDYPSDMRAKTFLTNLYTNSGQFGKTVALAQKMLEIAPNRQQFHFILGEAYLRSGQLELAVDVFARAFVLDTSFVEPRRNYALSLIYAGRVADAEGLLDEAELAEGQLPLIIDERFATAYIFRGDFKKVRDIWEGLVESQPNVAQYRFNLAQVYIRLFQDAQAVEQIELAMELAPSFGVEGAALIEQIRNGTVTR